MTDPYRRDPKDIALADGREERRTDRLECEMDNVPWEAESRPDYEPPDKPFFGSRMDSLAAPLTRPGMEHPAAWNGLSLSRHPGEPESS